MFVFITTPTRQIPFVFSNTRNKENSDSDLDKVYSVFYKDY